MKKIDIYQQVTDKIIADLEKGVSPWQMPWVNGGKGAMRPLRACGVPYQGINILLLWSASTQAGYLSRYWTTFKQAQELGGSVRKGEKGTHIVYFKTLTKTEQNAQGEDITRNIPMLRDYTVFNADQCDGLPEHMRGITEEPPAKALIIEDCEDFFRSCGSKIEHGGHRAFYCPGSDHIQMPDLLDFKSTEGYYSTLAHEHIHWTSTKARCDRELGKRFGDKQYAVEELIAELGAAFLCADLYLAPEPQEDHAAYLATWLKVLKDDKRAIFTAASAASKAAEYLASLQQPVKDLLAA
jgi:antirestriction protein ArdC